MTKVTTEELEAITEICWYTIDNMLRNEKEQNIIHWFTRDIIEFLNEYCTKEKPAI